MSVKHQILRWMGPLAAVAIIANASIATAQGVDEIAMYKGADRQQRLLDGAQKEGGQVTIYSSMIVDQALRPLLDGFQAKYPFMKPQYVREDPPQQLQKISAESRANRRVGDVVESTGIETSIRAANLNQQFWSPELEAYDPERRDPENYWAPTRMSYIGACHNTKLVKSAEAPRSFEEVLDPKWTNKLVWSGNIFGGVLFIIGARNFMGEVKADAYLEKLSRQNIVNVPSANRTVVDQVLAGEYAICLDAFLHHPMISARKGAPVASIPWDPVITMASSVMLTRSAPHPHSAMLFIDFLLSKEGQLKLQGADYFPARADVPANPDLDAVVPRKLGMKENFITPARFAADLKKSREIYERLFVK